jgi:hypothetical protein
MLSIGLCKLTKIIFIASFFENLELENSAKAEKGKIVKTYKSTKLGKKYRNNYTQTNQHLYNIMGFK